MADTTDLRQHAWVKAFMPDDAMQKLFIATQAVRDMVISQVVFFVKVYKKLYIMTQGSDRGFKVGIIGLGQIGKMLLMHLVELDIVKAGQVIASTRNWERHSRLNEEGITVVYDNARVAAECDVVVLCCLPYHAETVATSLKEALHTRNQEIFSFTGESRPKSMVISTLAAFSISRLKQLLGNYLNVLPVTIRTEVVMRDVASMTFEEGAGATKALKREVAKHIVNSQERLESLTGVFMSVFFSSKGQSDHPINEVFGNAELRRSTSNAELERAFSLRYTEIMEDTGEPDS
jgi:hypothetical protein